ncbi:MAG: putative MFS family arabinose efflux permease [Gammaproteobacteria bacterium]|jgi:predicted MFS family arabinose efflux permease
MATNFASSTNRRYVLGVLVLAYTVNFIDRQILSILLESIKQDLGVSDQMLGLLSGFAFALFYVVMGIPIAVWADRGNRRNLISVALALWSAMTALCGLAQNFWQLAGARIGVGIGEAGCTPPAFSLLSDYYAPGERAFAFGIYSLGIPFGLMFGLFIGGWINEVFGWRMAFFVVGLPGILLALVVRFTISEPVRGQVENKNADVAKPRFFHSLKFLSTQPVFVHCSIGGALAAFVAYAAMGWYPSFLIRSHGLGTAEIGLWLGLIMGVAGAAGMLLGGWLSDKLGARNTPWYLWTVAVGLLIALPFSAMSYLVDDPYVAMLLFSIQLMVANAWLGPTVAQIQGIVELRMRAVSVAVLFFITNLIGLGLGPWVIGTLSDALRPQFGDHSLRWSLFAVGFFGLWAAWHYYRAGQLLEENLKTANATPALSSH